MNPVFIKEQMIHYRAPKLFARTSLFTICLSLLLILVAFCFTYLGGGPWMLMGKHLLFLLIIIIATSPVRIMATMDTVVGEKEHNTYNTLVISALSPLQFILGKMWHLIFLMSMIQFQMLPLLLVGYLFGGHNLSFIFLFFLVLIAHNALLASIHLYLASIPMAHLSQRYTKFYSTHSLQKNMASSLTTLICTLPVCFIVIFWVNSMGSGGLTASLASTHLNIIKMFSAFSPILTVYFWGDVVLFGMNCPLWLFAIFLNLLLTFQVTIATETYHRNLDDDPAVTFRTGFFITWLFLELFFLAGVFTYGTNYVKVIPFLFSLAVVTYLVFRLVLLDFQPREESLSFKERIRLNFFPKDLFAQLKSTTPGYFLLLAIACYLLFGAALYFNFGLLISGKFFFQFVLILSFFFFGLFGFAHFLSSLKNGSLNSPFGLTFLIGILYFSFTVAPRLFDKLVPMGFRTVFWFQLLDWIGTLMILLNPFLLLYWALYLFEGSTGIGVFIPQQIFSSFPFEYVTSLLLFIGSYFFIGLIFYLRGRRNLRRLQLELPAPPGKEVQAEKEATTAKENMPMVSPLEEESSDSETVL